MFCQRPNNFDFDSNFVGDNNNVENQMDVNINMMNTGDPGLMQGVDMVNPISECPQEKVIHKTIYHDVPHVCPIRTRIINHHIYRHTYRPAYSCCEENTVSNIQCGSCNQFR